MKYKIMCESPNLPKTILRPTAKRAKNFLNSPDIPASVLKAPKKGK